MVDIQEVWTIPSALAAAVAGLFYAGFLSVSLKRSLHGHLRPSGVFVIGVNVLMATFLFTVSQAAAAIYVGDSLWYRAASRYGMWWAFTGAMVIVLLIAVRRRSARATP